MVKKLLASAIFIIIIGLTFIPSINAYVNISSTTSFSNQSCKEEIEFIVTKHHPDGMFDKTIVKISKDEALELEEKLRNIDNPNERLLLYKEYGLIPEYVTRESLQQNMLKDNKRLNLINDKFKNLFPRIMNIQSKNNITSFIEDPNFNENYICELEMSLGWGVRLFLGLSGLLSFIPLPLPALDFINVYFGNPEIITKNGENGDWNATFAGGFVSIIGFVGISVVCYFLPILTFFGFFIGYCAAIFYKDIDL